MEIIRKENGKTIFRTKKAEYEYLLNKKEGVFIGYITGIIINDEEEGMS